MKVAAGFLLLFFVHGLLAAGEAWAEASPPTMGTLGFKAGLINFTTDAAENLDIGSGPYVGVEAFAPITDRLHLGGEVGLAKSDGSIPLVETQLTYLPVELNLKYLLPVNPYLTLSLGSGISYNFVELEQDCLGACFARDEDWLLGGQAFGGIKLDLGRFLFGAEWKYQVTEDDLDNWRVTGQVGFEF